MRGLSGSDYGRRMYEIMRYWGDDDPKWNVEQHAFAAAWRAHPKWVVSRSLTTFGPNAALIMDDLGAAMCGLKDELAGEISASGSELAHSLADLGMNDEYRLYFHPVVLGRDSPFFARPRPRLRLLARDMIGEDTVRLSYVPA